MDGLRSLNYVQKKGWNGDIKHKLDRLRFLNYKQKEEHKEVKKTMRKCWEVKIKTNNYKRRKKKYVGKWKIKKQLPTEGRRNMLGSKK